MRRNVRVRNKLLYHLIIMTMIFDDHGDQGKIEETDILQIQVTFPENKARGGGLQIAQQGGCLSNKLQDCNRYLQVLIFFWDEQFEVDADLVVYVSWSTSKRHHYFKFSLVQIWFVRLLFVSSLFVPLIFVCLIVCLLFQYHHDHVIQFRVQFIRKLSMWFSRNSLLAKHLSHHLQGFWPQFYCISLEKTFALFLNSELSVLHQMPASFLSLETLYIHFLMFVRLLEYYNLLGGVHCYQVAESFFADSWSFSIELTLP